MRPEMVLAIHNEVFLIKNEKKEVIISRSILMKEENCKKYKRFGFSAMLE